ncbi:hypothetical protein HG535_0C02870 [Zygotorulaspora mrakii]|uniref:U1-type domain-containing protein n=1 Tax=Zygotorulaspora mrakii TaxID=42260 RepID=A0A7H9AZR1_ZYGMR|nr:uncharacterized protein HG535_0C02870 [Zygotorulaspora mrakii]QLG71935.1 hypothetical protein HG535_0C02870 [Zygotorulaspora mrakii]
MDYQNRAGSKKGTGGLVSDAQENLSRRKQVENLLRDGEEVPYTFQQEKGEDDTLKKNPYIYRNHSGKLVCKLCNTMHMSWSSVERHINGKKHALNLIRRGNQLEKHMSQRSGVEQSQEEIEFKHEVESRKLALKSNAMVPSLKKAFVQNQENKKIGIAVQVDYSSIPADYSSVDGAAYSPLIRIVTGLELSDEEKKDKKYLVIAYEPFENVGIELPSDKEVIMNDNHLNFDAVDELNEKCALWDNNSKVFYVQVFFQ